MFIRLFALTIALLGFWGVPGHAQTALKSETHKTTLGILQTAYWQPPASTAKQPLLLFSHGFDSCNTQSSFIMQSLADDGYWVFAPNHEDLGCALGKGYNTPQTPFGEPENWSDKTYSERADDMRILLDALHHDARFKNLIDFNRLGLVGHSLGGYTVLGLAGAWPGWTLPGVKAVLAFAPYTEPYVVHKTLGDIKIPVMFQGGTRDADTTPPITDADGAYDQTAAPKYYVEFDDAAHLAWTDWRPHYTPTIVAYSIAFLDHYVKGLPATPALTAVGDQVSALRYDSELGVKK